MEKDSQGLHLMIRNTRNEHCVPSIITGFCIEGYFRSKCQLTFGRCVAVRVQWIVSLVGNWHLPSISLTFSPRSRAVCRNRTVRGRRLKSTAELKICDIQSQSVCQVSGR
jgi:hypothetical protein